MGFSGASNIALVSGDPSSRVDPEFTEPKWYFLRFSNRGLAR